jgi:hypothetical protein
LKAIIGPFCTLILAFAFYLSGMPCVAQSQAALRQLEDEIAAKRYVQAAVKNVELLKAASAATSRSSTKEFRALQDVTSRLVTLLADNGKVMDADRLSKWHFATASKLFGARSVEGCAALEDLVYVSYVKKSPHAEHIALMERQAAISKELLKAGKFVDGAWLHERNKERLSRMIDGAFASVQSKLNELDRKSPDLKTKNTK